MRDEAKDFTGDFGHSDIGITMNLYCHVMDETKVKEMKMVDVAL